jgi:uncharacterized coiled-coil protein SlyX
MESRLIDLEVRYSYLERALRDLDSVVLELRTEVAALRRKVQKLEELVTGDHGVMPPNEKPPHY